MYVLEIVRYELGRMAHHYILLLFLSNQTFQSVRIVDIGSISVRIVDIYSVSN